MSAEQADNLADYVRHRMDQLSISSIRGLASRVGIAPETARRVLTRGAAPDEQTLKKLAEHLPAPLQLLRQLTGRPPGERTPFVLPPEADQLNDRQREVILSMVYALLEASTRGATASECANASDPRTTLRPVPRLVGRVRNPNGATPPTEASDRE